MSEKLEWQEATCEMCGWFKKDSTEIFSKKEIDDGYVPKVSVTCRRTNWAGSEDTSGESRACPDYVHDAVLFKCVQCNYVDHIRRCDAFFCAKQNGWARTKDPNSYGWLCWDCSSNADINTEGDGSDDSN